MAKYIPTIGLEIHAELKTKSKMFCDSPNDPDEQHPNINVCPICLGHPGTLPVINKKAIEHMVRIGTALHCKIAEHTKFDRKNYFYPDLPKGYQISQYDMPICGEGYLEISSGEKIKVQRIHLEEDTGRLQHDPDGKHSLVDFNRAGVPLMELVTFPVIHDAETVRAFAEMLQLTLRYLEASDANMEKGQMRVEVNLSIAPEGSEKLGTKVEVKNLNSLRVAERATAYEIERQTAVLEAGEKVIQETRGWDENTQKTFSQRAKEDAHEYRYFPEPDLPPLVLTPQFGINLVELSRGLPELPQQKYARMKEQFGLEDKSLELFVQDPSLADFYEHVISELDVWEAAQKHDKESREVRANLYALATNYLLNNLRGLMQESFGDAQDKRGVGIQDIRITAGNFAEFISLVHQNVVSGPNAKEVLLKMYETGELPSEIVKNFNLGQVNDVRELEEIVEKILAAHPGPVGDYKNGKQNALQFLMGQVMKETKGKANAQLVNGVLEEKLKKL